MKRVVVAMSGGVDSSTAAAILKDEGYNVIGISMYLYPFCEESHRPSLRRNRCCSLQGINDARSVALKLKIPFYVLNFQKEFQDKVIDHFCQEYNRGRTPNPCILCNREIKFKLLLEKAEKLGAQYLATGHYARIEKNSRGYLLKKGVKRNGEQSYFLYTLTQEQMARILMVLGGYGKEEVRKIAKKFGLPVAEKEASQEICFVDGDYRKFLSSHFPSLPGEIVDVKGKVLGKHEGVACYTVGQRRGIGAYGIPFYVVSIDPDCNRIVVGPEEELFSEVLIAKDLHFISSEEVKKNLQVVAKIRYNHVGEKAVVSPMGDGKAMVRFRKPVRSATPGQAVVFYDGDVILGGGTIEKIVKSPSP
ncbi:MAG: tRNA 2-thiouridine(34) synthase MnmA [bacterium]